MGGYFERRYAEPPSSAAEFDVISETDKAKLMTLREVCFEIISQRLDGSTGAGCNSESGTSSCGADLLSSMLAHEELFSRKEIAETMANLIVAGAESNASAIAFTLETLASFPEVQRKIRDECAAVGFASAAQHGAAALRDLKYT